jgi:hypothetical protein
MQIFIWQLHSWLIEFAKDVRSLLRNFYAALIVKTLCLSVVLEIGDGDKTNKLMVFTYVSMMG